MGKKSSFWDRVADKYSKQPVADPESYQLKLKRTQELFTPESKVLEFGCGTGTTALIHAPHVKSILATDISEKMIEICNQKLADTDVTNVEFQQTTLEDLQVEPESFDVIMGHSILHLLPDMEAALARTFQLLKPGGVFVSSTVCMGESMARMIIPFLTVGRWFGRFPYVKSLRISTLEQKVKDAGFEIIESTSPGKKIVCFMIARKP